METDESRFHRKNHADRFGPYQWVFGRIERGTQCCFLVAVPDRQRVPLQSTIEANIQHGTRVISDGCAAYADLNTFGGGCVYHYIGIVHQENFVHPAGLEVHTQSIESLWKRAKKKLCNATGASHDLFESYMKEFM